mmetsp:Transcript_7022/g.12481  ORF Transcript_7022/g.12481 Transcript_7022/m.12481 type:complete len:402 (-) Transcript_7022:250-1455(-)
MFHPGHHLVRHDGGGLPRLQHRHRDRSAGVHRQADRGGVQRHPGRAVRGPRDGGQARFGYDGPYAQGNKSFTREPLAIVTKDGDPEFRDLCNWVVVALLRAEVDGITMEMANNDDNVFLAETTSWKTDGDDDGVRIETTLRNALSAVGNYGEMYARHLEAISPRIAVNKINDGNMTGLHYYHPFGEVGTVGPGPIEGGVIKGILRRGFLRCGIPPNTTFTTTQEKGTVKLDTEFCRALSASILQSETDNIVFVSVPSKYENISMALDNGDIDAYAGAQVNMNSDVRGLSFSKPYFYEDTKAYALATKEDDDQWADLVYWIVMATIHAEENVITQITSNEMPLVSLFGADLERMLRDTILAVGNYGEMFVRAFGEDAPREGRNMLNASPFGPEHFPLPFWRT